jgi:hypothetical protein
MPDSSITDWIQALSAAAGVLGLAIYAFDTRIIRRATLAQSEASRRPFIVPRSLHTAKVDFENAGQGPALSLRCRWMDTPDETSFFHPDDVGAVPVGGTFQVVTMSRIVGLPSVRMSGLRIFYKDTAGKEYWTTIRVENERFVIDTGPTKADETLIQKIKRWDDQMKER